MPNIKLVGTDRFLACPSSDSLSDILVLSEDFRPRDKPAKSVQRARRSKVALYIPAYALMSNFSSEAVLENIRSLSSNAFRTLEFFAFATRFGLELESESSRPLLGLQT